MAGSEPYSKIPVELDHSLKGQRSFFEASSFFSDHEEAQETLPIKGPPDSKKQKIDVDAKAKEIRQILRYFMVNRSEKAIEAYMAIQELNPDQIEEFFKKYPNLAEKITGHLPGEFLNDPGFGLQRGIAEGEEQKLIVEFENILKDYLLLKEEIKSDKKPNLKTDLPKTEKANKVRARLDLLMAMVKDTFTYTYYDNKTRYITLDIAVKNIIQKYPEQDAQNLFKEYGIEKNDLKSIETNNTRVRGGIGIGGKFLKTFLKSDVNKVSAGFLIPWGKHIGAKRKLEIEGLSLVDLEKSMGGTSAGLDFVDVDENGVKLEGAGEIDFSADFKKGEAAFKANSLPFNSINYQGDDFTFRSGHGVFENFSATLDWNVKDFNKGQKGKDLMTPDILCLTIVKFEMNNLRMLQKEETFGIGRLAITDIAIDLTQDLGTAKELGGPMKLFDRMITDMTDISSLLTNGILQSIYRFTSPTNTKDAEDRVDTRKDLIKLIQQQFYEDLKLNIYFGGLEVDNIYYVDKDKTTNDAGENLIPDIEYIEGLKAGASVISLSTIGVPEDNKKALFDSKKELLDLLNEKKLSKLKSRKESKASKEKNIENVQNKIKDRENKIAEKRREMQQLQPDIAFQLDSTINDFNLVGGNMVEKLGGELLKPSVENTEGLADATSKSLSFSTKFDQRGISDTRLNITDLVVPRLQLNGINYISEDNNIELTGNTAIFNNLNVDLGIHFKNQGEEALNDKLSLLENERLNAYEELDWYYTPHLGDRGNLQIIHQKIHAIDNKIKLEKENFDRERYDINTRKEIEALEDWLQDINNDILHAGPTAMFLLITEQEMLENKIAQLRKQTDIIDSISVDGLNISDAEICGLRLAFPNKKMFAEFDKNQPVVLQTIKVDNLLVRNTPSGYKAGAGYKGDKMESSLAKLTIPTGLVLTKQEGEGDALKTKFESTLNEVVADRISLNLLKSGGIEYELGALTGGGALKQFEAQEGPDAPPRVTIFELPQLQTDTRQSLLKGTYSNNLFTTVINLPGLEVPWVDLKRDDNHYLLASGTELKDISATTEVKFNPDDNALNKIESINIKAFGVGEFNTSRLSAKFKDKSIDIPGGQTSTIKGLKVDNLNLKSVVKINKAGEKELVYQLQEVNKATLEIASSDLPKGFAVSLSEDMKVNLNHLSSETIKIGIEKLESGGDSYDFSAQNLDAAGEVSDKGDKGRVVLDSKHITGSYTETLIGVGEDARKEIVIGSSFDIPQLTVPSLDIKSDKIEISISKKSGGVTLNQINGDMEVTILKPSKKEKEAAEKKKQQHLDSIVLLIKKLDVAQLRASGLHLKQMEKVKDAEGNELPNSTEIEIPDNLPVMLNAIAAENLKITKFGKSMTATGKVSIGKEGVKGIDAESLSFKKEDKVKNTLLDILDLPLEADKLSFIGDGKTMAIEIGKPKVSTTTDTKIRYDFLDKNKEDFLELFRSGIGRENDIFSADRIKMIIDNTGKKEFIVTNPYLRNMPVNHDNTIIYVNGKVKGDLRVKEGQYSDTDTASAWIIKAVDENGAGIDIELTDLLLEPGESGKPKDLIPYFHKIERDPNKESHPWKVIPYENLQKGSDAFNNYLGVVDAINGNLILTVQGNEDTATTTIKFENGEIDAEAFGQGLGSLFHDVINQNLKWGDNAMDFFDWIEDYTSLFVPGVDADNLPGDIEVPTWIVDLFDGLDDTSNIDSSEFFAEWVQGQLRRANFATYEEILGEQRAIDKDFYPFNFEGKEELEGTYLRVGDIVKGISAIKIGNDELGEDQNIKVSAIIKYIMGQPKGFPEPERNFLPDNWNPNSFGTLEALFGELLSNKHELFKDKKTISVPIPKVGTVSKTIYYPNGGAISEAIGLWVPSRLSAWLLDRLKFDISVNNIDLEKIDGFKFNEGVTDKKIDMAAIGNFGEDSKTIEIGSRRESPDESGALLDILKIPGFSYEPKDQHGVAKNKISVSGITLDKTVLTFEKDASNETLLNDIANKKIVISGLEVKIKKK